MKPPFGTLNATLAKTIIENSPKYRRIVEPFGDGGTLALELAKRRPREHLVNVQDEDLFSAFMFVQASSSAEIKSLKKFDWIASQETLDKVSAISADAGPEFFYRWFYMKNFGMSMGDPQDSPQFDVLSAGDDLSEKLMGLDIMRVALKVATFTNDEPAMDGGGDDTLTILLPKTPEEVELARGRLSSISGSVFFAGKVGGVDDLTADVSTYSDRKVTAMKVASIMMADMSVVTNYDNKLPAFEPDATSMSM